MIAARVVKDDVSVDARLQETFGVTKDELIHVIREVAGARADAVENDPISAAGLLAYIHGVRNIRTLFRSKGWQLLRKDNIELVQHPERRLLVGYQSVDLAASEEHIPQAISGKGSGSERVIEEAQMNLFPLPSIPHVVKGSGSFDTGLWHLCVSVSGDDVRAELSLASGISGNNFKGFIERIFIVKKGEWADGLSPELRSDATDFEPVVVRKKDV